ncbi:hypothetical protein J8273_7265 [Carpediemonas membranifera]|uniref:Uncharacterized protein n=1 Tax=Carpediemonas membranifera TaxID=201153 RepID=A0A8J6AQ52_9EUKA|nr:hypothetical protein J8273_7265 [Carpediemonas membranifera]|eukprot:KAG9390991.1 hypothetical protein J8273_7265 [Carpediemonas membranifera]
MHSLQPESYFQAKPYTIPAHDAQVICPSAILHGNSFPLWFLLTCYITIGVVAILYAVYNLYTSPTFKRIFHNLISFKTLFCLMALILSSLRTVHLMQWTSKDRSAFSLFLLCEEMPLYVQCALYFIVVVFLGHTYVKASESGHLARSFVAVVAGVTLVVLAVIILVLCSVASVYTRSWRHEDLSHVDRYFEVPNVMLFSLAFLIGFGFLVRLTLTFRRSARQHIIQRTLQLRVTVQILISFLYLTVFLVRALYQLLDFLSINPVEYFISRWMAGDYRWYYWTYSGFYFIFEVVPTAMILFTFVGWRLRDVSRKIRKSREVTRLVSMDEL